MFGEAIATMVWSMNVIATANIMAASARFFLARNAPVPAPDSVMQLLPVSTAGRAGLLPPAVSRTIRRSRARKARLWKTDRRGRTVAGMVTAAWW
jgi:hypothetical protein